LQPRPENRKIWVWNLFRALPALSAAIRDAPEGAHFSFPPDIVEPACQTQANYIEK
jgi:hypothetical protein